MPPSKWLIFCFNSILIHPLIRKIHCFSWVSFGGSLIRCYPVLEEEKYILNHTTQMLKFKAQGLGELEISALVGFVRTDRTKLPRAKKTAQNTMQCIKTPVRQMGKTCCCLCAYDIIALVRQTHSHLHFQPTGTLGYRERMYIPQAAWDATKYAKFLCQSANENTNDTQSYIARSPSGIWIEMEREAGNPAQVCQHLIVCQQKHTWQPASTISGNMSTHSAYE